MGDLSRREFLAGTIALFAGLAAVGGDTAKSRKSPMGDHFWNWDRAWDKGEFLETRLTLTMQIGYDGFEAKPHEIGRPPETVREKCAELGIRCAAVGGALKEAIDYAFTAGVKIVRSGVPKEETKRWVDYAGERDIIIVIHPHIGQPGRPGAVETREDLLRYLDERPGVFACPDTGHLALCGSDPARTIRDLGRRCRYIHLKDIRRRWLAREHTRAKRSASWAQGLWT